MAYSGTIGGRTTSALKVVDHAFRRCRLPAQAITAEMQSYALDNLRFMLNELANIKTPSWCIEKVLLPMYENQPIVTLPVGRALTLPTAAVGDELTDSGVPCKSVYEATTRMNLPASASPRV